jgi:hypothetical protein
MFACMRKFARLQVFDQGVLRVSRLRDYLCAVVTYDDATPLFSFPVHYDGDLKGRNKDVW